jgi:ABC-type multidrug transport system ATPase subunit
MGPSGAGKSTLLNCLAGRLTTGVTGDITVNGSKVDPVKFRRNIAYVMQEVSEATRYGCCLLSVVCCLFSVV